MKSPKKSVAPAVEVPWENPLIPSKRLRELYARMAELRLLEEHLYTLQRRSKPSLRLQLAPGEEACRVSTVLSLLPGDLTSDPIPGIATRFLRKAKLADVIEDGLRGGQSATGLPIKGSTELPVAIDTERRLLLAIGAALALAAKKKDSMVLAYVYTPELHLPEWKPIFRLAAAHAAPIIFVALPAAAAKSGKLSELSTSAGVPGIPVDATDAVALYRVVQESMVRVRAGGGPVLMECIAFELPGQKASFIDPVQNMRASLIHRKIADEDWFESVDAAFTAKLKTDGL